MKILGISCSPRENGNTVAMLTEALHAAKESGAEVELYSVAGKDIQFCDSCWSCWTTQTGKCHIKDDLTTLLDKMADADGIIFGVPVYFHGMSAQSKAIIDRTIALASPRRNLLNKVCGVVVSAGELGIVQVLKDFTYYIYLCHMVPANQVSAYMNIKDSLDRLPKCQEELNILGRQMVAMVNLGFKHPPEFIRGVTTFGTHKF